MMSAASMAVVLATLAAACTGTVGDGAVGVDPAAELGLTGPGMEGAWDEARAAEVDPCEGAGVAACGDATSGACGVVALASGEQCIPLFNWGVTADGTVQFGSQARLFTLDDLERAPLTAAERTEGEARRQLFEGATETPLGLEGETEGALEPLVGISHSKLCVTYTFCYANVLHIYHGHYNREVAPGTWEHLHSTTTYQGCGREQYIGPWTVSCGYWQGGSW